MKKKVIVIMFLIGLFSFGCQTSEQDTERQAIFPSKPTLFQSSGQMDSSQGNAMAAEPVEKDPTIPTTEPTTSNRKKKSRYYKFSQTQRVSPERPAASEPNSRH